MKQDDIWQGNGAVTLCGDRAFWKGVVDEVAERSGGDAAGMLDALEAAMTEKVGYEPGWQLVRDIYNKRDG